MLTFSGVPRPTMQWTGLVLAALVVASCFRPAEAAHIVYYPPNPRIGQNVNLHVQGVDAPVGCTWFRGNIFNRDQMIFRVEFQSSFLRGPAFTGRESQGWACSMIIQGLQASDAGEYSAFVFDLYGNPQKAVGQLHVSN